MGGYLGAGKTTLVNYLLRASEEKIAVIINDFGEISIDEDLIVAADADKLTLANGCICCSLADGFAAALTQIRASEPAPQRLVIEASGVSDPTQVAAYGHTPGLRLDAVVVLVDAETARERANDKWVADTVRRQIAAADLLVVNKVDLISSEASPEASEALVALCDWLVELAPSAGLVRATNAEVPLEVLFDLDGAADSVADSVADTGAAIDPHSSGDSAGIAAAVFESYTLLVDEPVPLAKMEAMLADLPDFVLRLKGIVKLEQPDQTAGVASSAAGEYVIQAVGRRSTITPHNSPRPSPSYHTNPRTDPSKPTASAGPARHALSLVARKGSPVSAWLESHLGLPQ